MIKKAKKVGIVRRVDKKKGMKAQRVKPPTSCHTINALIGDEEQNGNQKKRRKRKKEGEGSEPSYFGPFVHL